MGEHHAGVTPGPQDGRSGHGSGCLRKRRVAERDERLGHGAEGQTKVGAGVSVRNRKDVDPVDLIPAGSNPIRSRQD
jgi:hypothetical protein